MKLPTGILNEFNPIPGRFSAGNGHHPDAGAGVTGTGTQPPTPSTKFMFQIRRFLLIFRAGRRRDAIICTHTLAVAVAEGHLSRPPVAQRPHPPISPFIAVSSAIDFPSNLPIVNIITVIIIVVGCCWMLLDVVGCWWMFFPGFRDGIWPFYVINFDEVCEYCHIFRVG